MIFQGGRWSTRQTNQVFWYLFSIIDLWEGRSMKIIVHSWSFAVDTRIGNQNMCTIVSAVAQLWAETLLKTSATAAIATATIATTSNKTATTVTNNSSNKQPKAKQQQQRQQQEHHKAEEISSKGQPVIPRDGKTSAFIPRDLFRCRSSFAHQQWRRMRQDIWVVWWLLLDYCRPWCFFIEIC